MVKAPNELSGCIHLPAGITVYYIDFKKKANKRMGELTYKANKKAWLEQLNINQRINFKSAYPLEAGKLFYSLHLLNIWFGNQPYSLIT